MSKKYLNTIPLEETIKRLHDGEKIFNDNDDDAYAKYVDGLGICKFRKKTDELLVANFTLSLFHQLYFNNLNEDFESMVGCVGWFEGYGNENGYGDEISLGILTKVAPNGEDRYCFLKDNNIWCKSFHPAKKSELKFYGEEE